MPNVFCKINSLEKSDALEKDLERIYQEVDLAFIPFLFNQNLSERSLVKVLISFD
jgi:hypothetical protein